MVKKSQFDIGLLLGPYGVGKDTHAGYIGELTKLVPLSIKEILDNDEIIKSKFLGRSVLIPDVEVFRVLNGFNIEGHLLNGFPRTIEQVNYIIANFPSVLLILLEANTQLLRERLKNRLICSKCFKSLNKSIHNIKKGDKCQCGGIIKQREEDENHNIIKRERVYNESILNVINSVREKFFTINIKLGLGSIEDNNIIIKESFKGIN